MRLLNNFLFELLAPTEVGGETSINDMIDLMGEDDTTDEKDEKVVTDTEGLEDLLGEEKEPDDKEVKSKSGEKEEKEETEEETEPEIDDLENIEDVPRQAILKKYPDLFKEFPQLEHAYYREKKYAELLPTLDDAQQAVEKSQQFDAFEGKLLNGELEPVLTSLKSADDKSFAKIVDNYLPSLAKVDQNAYYHVLGDVIKNTIIAMTREGRRIENQDLQKAAVLVHQFIFGNSEFKPPTKFAGEANKETDEATTELQNQRQQIIQEKFDNVLENLTSTSQNIIKSTVSKHLDPKNVMTDYVKRTALKEAVNEIDELINSDVRFKSVLDKLWEKAFENNFSQDSLKKIKTAYLNKATTILPAVIKKHRNAALKGLGKRVTEEREEPQRKGLIAKGGPASTVKKGDEANKVPRGMKTLDFLNAD